MASPAQHDLSTVQRVTRVGLGLVGAAAGFAALAALLIHALDRAGQAYVETDIDFAQALTRNLQKQADFAAPPAVVFLGDSLTMETDHGSVPRRLRRFMRLARHPQPVGRLANISAPGLTAYSHYFMSEGLAGFKGERYILSVNPGWFTRNPQGEHPVLAGLLPMTRWPEATSLPLEAVGLSADGILTSHALMSLGLMDTWAWVQREQVRFERGLRKLEVWLQRRVGRPRMAPHARIAQALLQRRVLDKRPTHAGAIERWGPMLDGLHEDNPTLQMMEAVVRRLRETGAPVLVIVPPTNVDALRRLGLYQNSAYPESLDQIRAAAERGGAEFLDLHDLLGDRAFKDPTDHLALRQKPSATVTVAQQLVLWTLGAPDWHLRFPVPPRLRPAGED